MPAQVTPAINAQNANPYNIGVTSGVANGVSATITLVAPGAGLSYVIDLVAFTAINNGGGANSSSVFIEVNGVAVFQLPLATNAAVSDQRIAVVPNLNILAGDNLPVVIRSGNPIANYLYTVNAVYRIIRL